MVSPETTDSRAANIEELVIAGWVLQATAHRIERGDRHVKLEPKTTRLLAYLAAHAGKPISREVLLEAVWPGVVVGDEALTNAVNKLRRAFGDDRQHPRIIETIPKMGYRLIAHVETRPGAATEQREAVPRQHAGFQQIDSGALAKRPGVQATPKRAHRTRWITAAALLSLLALALFGLFIFLPPSHEHQTPAEDAPDLVASGASIAVLPFDNLGGVPDQDYFSDGITDDLITSLAKYPDLLVISRDSTFVYKHKPLDIALIASKLNVRYILHGSVRRVDQQVRINAQLIETSNGSLLWAETYDGRMDDIFALQDGITKKILSALAPRLKSAGPMELQLSRTSNARAYNNLLIGRQHFYLFYNKEENRKAREFFRTATQLDPDFALAYAMLAWTYAFDAMNGWSDDREASLLRARELATRAIDLEQALPVAYFVRGLSYRELGEYVKALVEAQKAIEYDPNYAHAYMLLASLLYYAGRPEEGLRRIQKAMQINPHHPYNYTFHLGQAYYILGRYQEAIDAFQQGVASNPASERLHVWLAAAYAQLGETDSAEWETQQVLTLNPDFSLQRIEETYPSTDPEDRKNFIDSLRSAGLRQ